MRTMRTDRAISLLAMEDKTGIAISKLMRIELGQVDVTLLTLDMLARALGMTLSEMLVWH